MIPLSHSYRRFEKNPFKKERVVFAGEDPDALASIMRMVEGQVEEASKSDKNRETVLEDLREIMSSPVDYADRSSVEQVWEQIAGRYESILSFERFVIRQHKLLHNKGRLVDSVPGVGPIEPPFDWQSSIWRDRVAKINTAYAKANQVLGLNKSLTGSTSLDIRNQAELEAARVQIMADSEQVLQGLQEQKAIMLENLKERAKEDMKKRLDWLHEQWDKNPPPFLKDQKNEAHLRAVVENRKQIIREAKEGVGRFEYNASSDKKPVEQIKDMWLAVRRIELVYENEYNVAKGAQGLSYQALRARADALEIKQKEIINARSAAFNAEKAATIAALDEAIAWVVRADPHQFGHNHGVDDQAGVKAQLEKLKKNILDAGDLSAILGNVLNDTAIFPKSDMTGLDVPKGMRNQVELLQSDKLEQHEKQAIMVYLNEAMNEYDAMLNNQDGQLSFGMKGIKRQADDLASQIQNSRTSSEQSIFDKYEIYWIAPSTASKAVDIIKEWAVRRFERTNNYNLGKAAEQALTFTRDLPYFRTLNNEFIKTQDSAEAQAVNEFKEGMENRDMWQITEIAETTTDKDVFKAALLRLTGHGRMRWDRIGILRQFNRFQTKVHFDTSSIQAVEEEARNLAGFTVKLETACTVMWDADTYAAMERDNQSHYSHELSANENYASAVSGRGKGGLSGELDHMLHTIHDKMHNEGVEYSDDGRIRVESHLYDELVEYGINSGGFSTHEGLYYVVQGLANGIIPPWRAAQYRNKFMNDYPAIEFVNIAHPLLGYPDKPVPVRFFKDVAKLNMDQFQMFFYDYVYKLPTVNQRLDKTISSARQVDHDMSAGIFPFMSTNSIRAILQRKSDGGGFPETGLLSGGQAMESIFKLEMAKGNEQFLKSFAGLAVQFAGTLTGRINKGGQYTTLSASSMAKTARSNDEFKKLTGDAGKSMAYNLKNMEDRLKMLDEDFFGLIFSYGHKDGDLETTIRKLEARYGMQRSQLFNGKDVKTVDDLALVTDEFVANILNTSQGHAKFLQLSTVASSEIRTQGADPMHLIAEWRDVFAGRKQNVAH